MAQKAGTCCVFPAERHIQCISIGLSCRRPFLHVDDAARAVIMVRTLELQSDIPFSSIGSIFKGDCRCVNSTPMCRPVRSTMLVPQTRIFRRRPLVCCTCQLESLMLCCAMLCWSHMFWVGDMIQKRLPSAEVVYNHKAVDKRSYKVTRFISIVLRCSPSAAESMSD